MGQLALVADLNMLMVFQLGKAVSATSSLKEMLGTADTWQKHHLNALSMSIYSRKTAISQLLYKWFCSM